MEGDVIVADGGSAPQGTPTASAPMAGSYAGHHHSYNSGPLSSEAYNQQAYSVAGANDYTMGIMLGSVALGYFILFFVLWGACLGRSHFRAYSEGFTRFDIENEPNVAYKSQPVSELDPMC